MTDWCLHRREGVREGSRPRVQKGHPHSLRKSRTSQMMDILEICRSPGLFPPVPGDISTSAINDLEPESTAGVYSVLRSTKRLFSSEKEGSNGFEVDLPPQFLSSSIIKPGVKFHFYWA